MSPQYLAGRIPRKIRLLGALVLCAIAVWSGTVEKGAAQSLTPDERGRIEQIIHDYLLSHPEVVLEALKATQAQDKQKQAEASRAAIAAKRKELLDDPADPVGGNPKGDVTLVEFFDYRCPYCKQVEPAVEAILKEDPKLRIVYKEFPILGKESTFAAHVAFAVLKQGKYAQFHDAMMAAKGDITEDAILKIAAAAGLDIAKLKADMNAPEIDQIIKRTYDLAETLGVNGTPGFVIGDNLIPGAADLATLKEMVATARKPN
jgi:protein-disulfide isomerase